MSLPAPAVESPQVEATSPAPSARRSTLASRAPYIAAAIALVAGFAVVNTLPVGGFYDDAFYVILAKSLATGHGYRNLNLPGTPFATHYPPGYSLFLALLWWIGPAFPANLVLFKVANAIFLGVAAAFACRLARERLGLEVAVAVVATILGTATTPALYLSSMVLSETMFLALTLVFLFWAEARIGRDEPDIRGALCLGACAGLLFLLRSQAVAVIGGVVVVYGLQRRWRESIAALGAATLVIFPWLLWVSAHDGDVAPLMRGDYGSYFAWFTDGLRGHGVGLVLETVRRNVPDMIAHVAHRLQPPAAPLPSILVSLGIMLFAIAGAARLVRRAPVTLLFLGGYLALTAIWPFPPVRFLLGIWVLLMLLLASGAQALLADRLPHYTEHRNLRLARRVLAGGLSLMLVGGAVAYTVHGYRRRTWATTEEQSWRWIGPKVPWVQTTTDSSAIIATDHDEGAIYLYTGRRSVPATTFTADEYLHPRSVAEDSTALRRLTLQYKADYLLLSSVRLRPAAAAVSTAGAPIDDGVHQVVPWAFKLRPR